MNGSNIRKESNNIFSSFKFLENNMQKIVRCRYAKKIR